MLFTAIALVVTVVSALITVPFYTLYERKLLSLSHIRLGPAIVGYFGLLQPISDAVKLFTNEKVQPIKSSPMSFSLLPALTVAISLTLWSLIPWTSALLSCNVLILSMLILMAASGMAHLGVGWSSNSSYSTLGALRCLAQGVSYEVSLAVLFLAIATPALSIDLYALADWFPLGLVLLPVALLWLLSCLAESNRSPFDFAEGESELVSGFNVEFGSGPFALLFIAEYAGMVFLSVLTAHVLVAGSPLLTLLASLVVMHWYVWIRAVTPRTRYDKLMGLCWTAILPCALAALGVGLLLSWAEWF